MRLMHFASKALFFYFLLCSLHPLYAASCRVAQPHALTDAETALLRGDAATAENLYHKAIIQHPDDPELAAGLVHALLKAQKVSDARSAVDAALAKTPQSVPLLTALGEVQYRQGLVPDAINTINQAIKLDVCYPRLHLFSARIFRLNSDYASERREVLLAHQLDPYNPDITRAWIQTLPLQQRIDELKKYLENSSKLDPESVQSAQYQLSLLENQMANPGKTCHLSSTATPTEIPFTPIMIDATRMRGWAIQVHLNNKSTRLAVDTGAGGIYVSHSVAEHAGLKPITQSKVSGIGDKGPQEGYTAYADSIRIGDLEFQDCMVEVSDRRNIVGQDGLIGMDVFSRFLVTLDFPWRKLVLAPLPPRPGENNAAPAALMTHQSSSVKSVEPEGNGPHDRYIAPEMRDYMPVYRIGHQMIVPTVLNNKTTRLFIIDTGAARTLVSPSAAREVTKVRSSDVSVRGISGRVNNTYSADKVIVRFAQLQQEIDDIISFDTTSISNRIGTEISGFIGFDLLHYLTISIDYRDGLMKFAYSADRGYQHVR